MRISDWSSDVCSSDLEVAALVVDKLWRQFVSEQPDAAERRRLAALFRAAGYEMRPLLAALLASEAFWGPENRGRMVKSPVDRSEEHTSELQSLMRISSAACCLIKTHRHTSPTA